MQPKLIIFDFDGTLADTTATILRTYHRTIDELHAEERTDAELRATIGFPLKEGFRHLYPGYTDAQLDECVVTYRRIFNEYKKELVPQLFPGVVETLDKLAMDGMVMTIASSRSRESLIEFCEATGIAKYFSLILGANDVVRRKLRQLVARRPHRCRRRYRHRHHGRVTALLRRDLIDIKLIIKV